MARSIVANDGSRTIAGEPSVTPESTCQGDPCRFHVEEAGDLGGLADHESAARRTNHGMSQAERVRCRCKLNAHELVIGLTDRIGGPVSQSPRTLEPTPLLACHEIPLGRSLPCWKGRRTRHVAGAVAVVMADGEKQLFSLDQRVHLPRQIFNGTLYRQRRRTPVASDPRPGAAHQQD